LPEDFGEYDEKIGIDFQPKFIQKIVKIGEVRSLEMNLYEVNHRSENDPRISLSRDSFRLLARYGVKRALILFISENSLNYRLSLVTIDLKWEEGKRVQKEYSNPRRYSFFLGPETKTHTPETYLIKKGRVKDFDDLKERFSLEIVNKDFYKQIAIRFTKLTGGERTIGRTQFDGKGSLYLPSTIDDKIKKEFSVRLIGRLVFCWFLKKKCSDKGTPLLPEELLSSKAVTQKPGFYHNILEPLFFETLNTPIKERKKEYQIPPWSQIPFLNGGLFANEYNDYYEIDQLGISKYINTLKVPDSWLKELFEIFEIYNFTIDENTSVDVELSIEPEMLGRIFENLLAEINPETGNTARKSTGSYYTPRPIVEYMVDESLKQYLLTKTNLNENKISSLLAYEEEEVGLSESEKDAVIDALDVIKIIDPACGSGAFPMGILQKMLLILQKIDPESKKWLNKKISQIENTIVREEFQKKIEAENWNYVHKLGIIQNSIYGVDIQPIAVDISKLRFFLSLIIDEKVDDSKDNRGIDSLPNLEFKFVCANSLIGLPSTLVGSYKKELQPQPKLFEAVANITELKKLREEYLRCVGNEKKLIEKKFQEIQSEMFLNSLNWGSEDSQTVKLSQWNPFLGESCAWFDPEWMFGIKDGFDIVIANPPYIKEYTDRKAFNGIRKSSYYQGKMDLWYFFGSISLDLLHKKGVECFIATNNWVSNAGASRFRNKIIEESKIIEYIDFGNYKIFKTADIQTMVFLLQKNKEDQSYTVRYSKLLDDKVPNTFLDIFLNTKKLDDKFVKYDVNFNRSDFKDSFISFLEPEILNILDKIKSQQKIIFLKSNEVANGIHPHHSVVSRKMLKVLAGQFKVGDGIFLLTEEEKNRLNLNDNERELLKPVYTSKELGKYCGNSKNFYSIIYTCSKFKNKKAIEPYLNIRKHLDKFQKVITSDNKPYGLHRSREEKFFTGEKILSLRKCERPVFTYTDYDCYVLAEYYVIKTNVVDLKYLIALLNSKLIEFWLFYKGKRQGNIYQIDKEPLINIPIKKAAVQEQKLFMDLVNEIFAIIKSEDYLTNPEKKNKVKEYEKQIDQMVYKLYGLTDDEIKIVENFHKKT
jgi:hypothetical protein